MAATSAEMHDKLDQSNNNLPLYKPCASSSKDPWNAVFARTFCAMLGCRTATVGEVFMCAMVSWFGREALN